MNGIMKQAARIAGLAVLVACGNGNEASAEDARMVDAAPVASTVPSDAPTSEQEIPRLDEEKLSQWFAALRALADLSPGHPELADIAVVDADLSAAENAARWEQSPVLRDAIEATGLSVLDYIMLNGTIVGAMMGSAMMNDAQLEELSQVERDNILFVKANAERIEAIMRELQGMEGR
jgi:hypothetical protein